MPLTHLAAVARSAPGAPLAGAKAVPDPHRLGPVRPPRGALDYEAAAIRGVLARAVLASNVGVGRPGNGVLSR
jgi:hypothetical protein